MPELLSDSPQSLINFIDYQDGSVVSKEVLRTKNGTVTFFAFAEEQGLSDHTAPFDAIVQIADGEADITIAGKPHVVKAGEMIKMPANVSHALHARTKFKMLLIMLKS